MFCQPSELCNTCGDYHLYLLQVMGIVRCLVYALSEGLGFPAFMEHQFIGLSKMQLLRAIEQRGLLTTEEIQASVRNNM